MLLMHDNGTANYYVIFKKFSKLVFFRSTYNAHYTFMQFYPVENQNFYEEAGMGLVKCSLTFKVGC